MTPTEVTTARLAFAAFQATGPRFVRAALAGLVAAGAFLTLQQQDWLLDRPACFQHAEDPVCADSRGEVLEHVTTDEPTEGEHLGIEVLENLCEHVQAERSPEIDGARVAVRE